MTPRHLRRTTIVAGSALVLLTSAATPAHATVTRSSAGGFQMSLDSDAAGDVIILECVGGQARQGGVDILPCADVEQIFVNGNGGADTIDLSAVRPADFPSLYLVDITGGDAADTIHGSQVGDSIEAPGDQVFGHDGDDVIDGANAASGGAGDDVLRSVSHAADGGPGDDVIRQPANGPIVGGAGTDTLALDYPGPAGAPLTLFTLTDDSIRLQIPSAPYEVTVSSVVERYEIRLPSTNTQSVDSRTFSGAVEIYGNAGVDVLRAGAGEDFLFGGQGNDQLLGGRGFDYLVGGSGNDVVDSRDGAIDRVRCGDGSDVAVADRVDLVEACEQVQVPPPATGPVTGPKRVSRGTRAAFTFTSSVPGSTFQCRVDARPWRACRSPYRLGTKGLKPGKHVLHVRAVQPAGNPDPTPSRRPFRVTR